MWYDTCRILWLGVFYRLIPILRCWGEATHKKLTEVNGDAVEEEVTISSSIVDGDKALEVLVERFCWGVGLIAEEVVADLPDVLDHEVSDVLDLFTRTTEVISDDL